MGESLCVGDISCNCKPVEVQKINLQRKPRTRSTVWCILRKRLVLPAITLPHENHNLRYKLLLFLIPRERWICREICLILMSHHFIFVVRSVATEEHVRSSPKAKVFCGVSALDHFPLVREQLPWQIAMSQLHGGTPFSDRMAPPHLHLDVGLRAYLKTTLPDRWIGHLQTKT